MVKSSDVILILVSNSYIITLAWRIEASCFNIGCNSVPSSCCCFHHGLQLWSSHQHLFDNVCVLVLRLSIHIFMSPSALVIFPAISYVSYLLFQSLGLLRSSPFTACLLAHIQEDASWGTLWWWRVPMCAFLFYLLWLRLPFHPPDVGNGHYEPLYSTQGGLAQAPQAPYYGATGN